jgi:micrococcal nuclease
MSGTKVTADLVRVVDGDTIRVKYNNEEEAIRIMALDTEESHANSSKPVTPLGREASDKAKEFFANSNQVTLEFPGNEPGNVCWQKYRGNYGRVLAFVYRTDETDFQEYMIREGYSPYFTKYGYAVFESNHLRYTEAERAAQSKHAKVWDQITENGSEIRNYAALCVWWHLRAQIIDGYRRYKVANPGHPILNTRLDYAQLEQLAQQGAQATIFTELRDYRQVGGRHVVIGIGSKQQPFQVFIPNVDVSPGEGILNILKYRYLPGDLEHPRRSYVYITGPLSIYSGNNKPQLTVTSPDQISDWPT